MSDDRIQHGIDDDPNNDAKKGAELGGIGGAITGAIAGAAAGPVGMVAGAVIGGLAGGVASGAAVGAVDAVDNDNTISGVGHGVTADVNHTAGNVAANVAGTTHAVRQDVSNTAYRTETGVENAVGANGMPGVQTGGHAIDGTPDTRGITEKIADSVTGDVIDDKTGKPVI